MAKINVSPKQMVTISMGSAGVVALLALLDLALGIPFNRAMIMDILFLLSAGIVLYLAYTTMQEMN